MAVLMPSPKAPCKDCAKRTAGCWSSCEDYAEFRKAWTELQKKIKKANKDNAQIYRYISEQQCKCTRKNIREY